MQTPDRVGAAFLRRLLPALCAGVLAATTAAAAEPKEINLPVNERLLAHLETTTAHLAAQEQSDPALKKDFKESLDDKGVQGSTVAEISASMAARHPRLAAALAAEGWKPADFLVAFGTVVMLPLESELSKGGESDTNKTVQRNIVFYDQHKARVDTLIAKLTKVMGAENKR